MTSELTSLSQHPFLTSVTAGLPGQVRASADGTLLTVSRVGTPDSRFAWTGGVLRPLDGVPEAADVLAVAEAVYATQPTLPLLRGEGPLGRALSEAGVVVASADGQGWEIPADLLWQQAGSWLSPRGQAAGCYPLLHTMTNGKRHPLRRPKIDGVLYERFIPWLNETISFRLIDVEQDAERLNRWMNDPRVAVIWEETGDLDVHRAYIETKLADPHMVPVIGCFDGQPFGYFEVYWAKENRIAPYYDAEDFDRGWHVLVGEDAYRGKARVSAWLPSLMHFMFLDDPRTQRIVGEPAASHSQQIRNLERSGFAKVKQFSFPHKRAMLVMLLRERFFGERLWAPQDDSLRAAAVTSVAAE